MSNLRKKIQSFLPHKGCTNNKITGWKQIHSSSWNTVCGWIKWKRQWFCSLISICFTRMSGRGNVVISLLTECQIKGVRTERSNIGIQCWQLNHFKKYQWNALRKWLIMKNDVTKRNTQSCFFTSDIVSVFSSIPRQVLLCPSSPSAVPHAWEHSPRREAGGLGELCGTTRDFGNL